MSTNEHIHCTDVICICGKPAVHAAKVLCSPTFFRHRFAERTCSGGISGIDSNKTNTVLLRQTFDPCDDLPVCPRSDCFAKTLTSAGAFAQFQVLQSFDAKAAQDVPGESFHLPVNVVLPGPGSTKPALTARFAATYPSADLLGIQAVLVPVGVDKEFVDSDVNAECSTCLGLGVGQLDPERGPSIAKRTALEQIGARLTKPMVESPMALERNDDGFALDQPRNLEHVVEGAFPVFDLGHEAAQPDGAFDPWRKSVV